MLAGVVVVIMICAPVYAEEEKEPIANKTQGVEIIPDTAATILKKLNAFFAGNLEWTMPADKDKYKEDYSVDPTGMKRPRTTLKKYDSGVR